MKTYHMVDEDMDMKKTIMIVDDVSQIRDCFGELMEELGFKALKAEGGEKALELIEKEKVDCILLDLNMPGMDGVQTVQKIRESKKDYKNVPIFIVSAFTSKATRQKCFLAGINELLLKPLSLTELKKCLNKWKVTTAKDALIISS